MNLPNRCTGTFGAEAMVEAKGILNRARCVRVKVWGFAQEQFVDPFSVWKFPTCFATNSLLRLRTFDQGCLVTAKYFLKQAFISAECCRPAWCL